MENETPTTSPLPSMTKAETNSDGEITYVELKEMDFFDAIREIMHGDTKVTRTEWGNNEEYCLLKDGILTLHKADGKFYSWLISDGDINAVDWNIV